MTLTQRLEKIIALAESTRPLASVDTLEARLRAVTAPIYQTLLLQRQAATLKRVVEVLDGTCSMDFKFLHQLTVNHNHRYGPDTPVILAPTQDHAEEATASAQKMQQAAQALVAQGWTDLRRTLTDIRRKIQRVFALQKIPEIGEAVGDSSKQAEFKQIQTELLAFISRLDRSAERNDIADLQRIDDLITWRLKVRKWGSAASEISLTHLQKRHSLSDSTVKILSQLVAGKSCKLAEATPSELADILKLPGLARMLSIRLET